MHAFRQDRPRCAGELYKTRQHLNYNINVVMYCLSSPCVAGKLMHLPCSPNVMIEAFGAGVVDQEVLLRN